MYNLDELRTYKLHYITEEPCENLTYKKGETRKLHLVLTYKMENKQSGCINRDQNAVNNMIKIVNHHIKYKERPLRYRRSFDLTKDSNPLNITLNNELINIK